MLKVTFISQKELHGLRFHAYALELLEISHVSLLMQDLELMKA